MSFLHMIKKIGNSLQSVFLLALRLIWGFWFLQSGLGKWKNFGSVIDYFRELGIPYPELNAYAAMFTEIIGGTLLILGLFSRVAAIPLIIVMIVALATAHHEALSGLIDDPQGILKESPFTFLIAALTVFVFGPGKISLDYLLGKGCNKCCEHDKGEPKV